MPSADPSHGQVTLGEDRVTISRLVLDDPVIVDLVRRHPEDDRARLLERMVAVGARGLMTMGVGVDLAQVDERVRHSLEAITGEAESRVKALLGDAEAAMSAALDPEQRTSLIARAMSDFVEWRDGFLRIVDPDVASSHTGRLVARLNEMLGPDGPLEQRLTAALDPQVDDSGLGRLAAAVDRRFAELRDLLAEQRGREVEAERGTAKGIEYETVLDERLRQTARHLGAIVERTSTEVGNLGGDAIVGDYVVTLPDGPRIVVEAKNSKSIALTGSNGILAELDRAMANRAADAAVCISATDAFPREVGPFAVYGNRLLVVDDGEGTMIWVGLRWAAAIAIASADPIGEVDPNVLADKLQRLRQLGQLFSSNRRALTDISGSVEKVRGSLESMRSELLELVDDLAQVLLRNEDAEVLQIPRQVG